MTMPTVTSHAVPSEPRAASLPGLRHVRACSDRTEPQPPELAGEPVGIGR
jgi:hypothetical protein